VVLPRDARLDLIPFGCIDASMSAPLASTTTTARSGWCGSDCWRSGPRISAHGAQTVDLDQVVDELVTCEPASPVADDFNVSHLATAGECPMSGFTPRQPS
jgi:hypothetical protein